VTAPASCPGPGPFLRETVDFDLPAPGAYAAGLAFLPSTDGLREGDGPDRDGHGRRGPHGPRVARRPGEPRLPRQDGPRRDAELPPAVRVCRRAPSSTRACSPRPSSGSSSRPDRRALESALRWCTPASPPTRSRRGRWRTRTATSPTTARSTPCRATELDAGPRGAARQRAPAGRPRAGFPICTPGASDTAGFDEALELLHLGGRTAAPRGADDDPRGVGEPRDHGSRPAGVLPVPRQR
jgi:hypothetical protein